MGIHIGETYHDVTVVLDGNTYRDCIFTNCQISYSGLLPVDLKNNTFDNVDWDLSGAAGNTVSFLQAMYQSGSKDFVEQILQKIRDDSF